MGGHSGLGELHHLHPRRRLGLYRGRSGETPPADGTRRNHSRRDRTPRLPRPCVITEGGGDERREGPAGEVSSAAPHMRTQGGRAHMRCIMGRPLPHPETRQAGHYLASPPRLSFPLRTCAWAPRGRARHPTTPDAPPTRLLTRFLQGRERLAPSLKSPSFPIMLRPRSLPQLPVLQPISSRPPSPMLPHRGSSNSTKAKGGPPRRFLRSMSRIAPYL